MADTKISALPAATTPLAGTEVLPIVQGGTTDQVSVANLTAGRAISALSTTVVGAANSNATSSISALPRTTVGQSEASFSLTASSRETTNTRQATYAMRVDPDSDFGAAAWRIDYTYDGVSYGTRFGVNSAGNLFQGAAGKGFDFNANTPAAGMTSQLLNWYETGTWTPTYVTSGTNFTSVTYNSATSGRYVRIGNLVFISCRIATDGITVGSASGELRVGGLPFPCNSAASAALSIAQAYNWASNTPIAAQVRTGATPTAELFYRTTVTGATSNNTYTDADTGASGKNQLFLAGCYYTA